MATIPRNGSARLRGLLRTRRRRAIGAVVVLVLAGGVAALVWVLTRPSYAVLLHSRPDLRPPEIEVLRTSPRAAPGHIFIAPKHAGYQGGPMILDARGRTVWFHPVPHGVGTYNFREQRYRGRPVLTWFQGRVVSGHGEGEGIIADRHYRVIARVHAGDGLKEDLHELQLTPRGTALITAYRPLHRDLTHYGGARDGVVYEGVLQEIDIRTGRVVFQWDSLDHVPLADSYRRPTGNADKPWDYFHINSIGVDRDGNLLISARHTSAIYKVDRRTGAVIWQLGGKHSDFRMGPGARFAAQHDVRRAPDGTITLFDNESPLRSGRDARGLALRLDSRTHTATVAHEWRHGLVSSSQGDVQNLPNGDVFIGWGGDVPYFSEYTRDGRLLFDARFVDGGGDSYRAYRLPWRGVPPGRPAIAAAPGDGGRITVYASWNGATDIRRWRVLGGPGRAALRPLGEGPWANLESEVSVPRAAFVAVQALAADGRILGTSRTIPVR